MMRRGLGILCSLLGCGMAWSAPPSPPVVRMLAPGFSVQELPVRLSNQNNLRFAPDGSLTSLGYDGRIWRLRDTDGDGLEDRAEPFWDQPTLSVPLGMAWSTAGLYVASKGKVSLIRDTDGDGRGDQEDILTSGWPATDVGSGGVDATAVTLDPEGNVYFGLLVADYSNAYRIRRRADLTAADIAWLQQEGRWREPEGGNPDQDEFSLYDLRSPRGTIQRWDPRTRRRETIATGLRVPVALAFNRFGDLFNTDQEGETWMPEGNPLDELNHIVAGRNYGFPPPHPRWLPDLVSMPPVVGFGPQHQSACGLVFNGPLPPVGAGGIADGIPLPASPRVGTFGPDGWAGHAFVAGESRGVIWRVQLEKTPLGYVGKSFPIARLSLLTLDLAISPRGEMYVACHSGPPDWGTGPQGEGRLFRIVRTDVTAAQPVLAWPSAPAEVRVHFDRKLPEAAEASLTDPGATPAGITIEFGNYVSAGDEGATLKPPYAVVEQQDATPRGRLAVHSARLEDEGTTLVLTTDPHSLAVRHVLKLPMRMAGSSAAPGDRMEVEYDFHGVAVTHGRHPIEEGQGRPAWSGVLPYPDWKVGKRFLQPWLAHSDRSQLPRPGGGMGTLAQETLVLAKWVPEFVPPLEGGRWMTLSTSNSLGTGRTHLRVGERLAFDAESDHFLGFSSPDSHRLLAPPLDSFWLPWAPTNRASSGTDSRVAAKPDGDWEHGRELFGSPQWNCAKCHRVRGEGGVAGPDLSNLVHRDPASVLRDIRDPGATLHPDYVAYRAELQDGELHVGFLRGSADGSVRMFDVDGRETVLARKEVANLHPTGQSLMPSGLLDGRSEGDIKDLLTFLLHEPPARTRSAVEALIPPAAAATPAGRPIRLVLVASKQDHGPGQHDYPAWQERWMRLLASAASNTVVEKAWEWPSAGQWAAADGVVFYFWNHEWTPERYAQLDAFQARGGGLVFLHSAVIADRDPEPLAERIGLSAQPGRTGYRHMPFDLGWAAPGHPLLAGLPAQIPFLDEPYWPLVGDPSRVTVLGQARVDGAERPLVWTFERGRGRVFASILGHYFWTLDDPLWRLLCLRGIAWSVGLDPAALTRAATGE